MKRTESQKLSDQQRKAIHLYLTWLSDALNEAGYDMKKTLSKSVDIPWTPISAKESLWKPLQKVMFEKPSTTELNPHQVSQVYEVINRIIGERTGVHVEFPSKEALEEYERTSIPR